MFAHMEAALAQHHDEVAAVIVEPLVQCAGGMRMYDPRYLKLLREACDRHGVHLIADEIAVGFGRTGTMFACEQAGIRPDYLCLSKGLTGGYLPLSVVMTTEAVYAAFYDEYVQAQCLPAFAQLYRQSAGLRRGATPRWRYSASSRCSNATARPRDAWPRASEHLRDHPHVAEIRQRGMILAIELVKDRATRTPYPWQERRGLRIYRHALERGALLRPLGTTRVLHAALCHRAGRDRAAGPGSHRRHRHRMRVTRIHVGGPLAPAREVALPEQAGQHLARVLRLEVGAPFVIFDGAAANTTAEIAARRQAGTRARPSHDAVERESPLDITLLQGIARGERMDLIVQKATELGVTRIVPVIAERSVVKVDAKLRERKREHWQAIVISACEQCGRNRVPAVSAPLALGDAIQSLPSAAALPAGRGRARIAATAAARDAGVQSHCSSGPKAGWPTTNGNSRSPTVRRLPARPAHHAHRNRRARGACSLCRPSQEISLQ